ncbi:hypothetical protein QIT30_gp31 [Saccharolobus solfataricus rod-shaped virus 1]|uniref:Uncharacterized protein n=1 Tax=Saccharolobus solfataricus rod-shaped virus 1 TaxID=2730619 RepID=A0A6M3VXG3_SSRV1|nr:hypothetical protein QIT30_gp31 [Saccharolobus solfataricus rod-shaped virus 1]QJF12307.1 hypothetical protein SSRV1_gp31 [Saccharolobus solfataricus rod-shaped virus 1]
MKVLKFKDEKEYKEWLKSQSGYVQEKAERFSRKYPGVLPIIIVIDVDTCHSCSDGSCHLFFPPWLEPILGQIVG